MKICPACSETFESHSRFCPIDGSILDQAKSRETYGYSPTLISDLPLVLRLALPAHSKFPPIARLNPCKVSLL